MSDKTIDQLGKVHVSRREAVRKLLVGAAFSLPVVMSFTMGVDVRTLRDSVNGSAS